MRRRLCSTKAFGKPSLDILNDWRLIQSSPTYQYMKAFHILPQPESIQNSHVWFSANNCFLILLSFYYSLALIPQGFKHTPCIPFYCRRVQLQLEPALYHSGY
jgi:hypothetical protein